MEKIIVTGVLLLGILFSAKAQDIASHQWKERVLIVMTSDSTDAEFKRQIQELNAHQQELTERKLKVYLTTPEAFRQLHGPQNSWNLNSNLYKTYNKGSAEPEVLLIGLDGGVKHHKYSFTPAPELFAIIDSMPMRQAEMQRNKKNNH